MGQCKAPFILTGFDKRRVAIGYPVGLGAGAECHTGASVLFTIHSSDVASSGAVNGKAIEDDITTLTERPIESKYISAGQS